MKTFLSNSKRSRLMNKTDEDLLLEILIRVENVGSFCPEKLMCDRNHQLFEEAFRRFGTWDEIVGQCIKLNLVSAVTKTPKEVLLEILKLERSRQSFQDADVVSNQPDLHAAAVLFYGSWSHAITITGLKECNKKHECQEL